MWAPLNPVTPHPQAWGTSRRHHQPFRDAGTLVHAPGTGDPQAAPPHHTAFPRGLRGSSRPRAWPSAAQRLPPHQPPAGSRTRAVPQGACVQAEESGGAAPGALRPGPVALHGGQALTAGGTRLLTLARLPTRGTDCRGGTETRHVVRGTEKLHVEGWGRRKVLN